MGLWAKEKDTNKIEQREAQQQNTENLRRYHGLRFISLAVRIAAGDAFGNGSESEASPKESHHQPNKVRMMHLWLMVPLRGSAQIRPDLGDQRTRSTH
jgi:hypothetical protein